jgi:hypothetical protein
VAAGLGSSEDRWAWPWAAVAAGLGLSWENRWVAAAVWPEGKRVAVGVGVGVGWPDDPEKLAASVLVSWPEPESDWVVV